MNIKFWSLQTKIYTLAVTIVALGSAWGLIVAKSNKINDSITARINCRAVRVADSCDSIQKVRRFPIDSAILARLDGIKIDVKRTTYFQEQGMKDADYTKAKALWVRDSIRWLRDK